MWLIIFLCDWDRDVINWMQIIPILISISFYFECIELNWTDESNDQIDMSPNSQIFEIKISKWFFLVISWEDVYYSLHIHFGSTNHPPWWDAAQACVLLRLLILNSNLSIFPLLRLDVSRCSLYVVFHGQVRYWSKKKTSNNVISTSYE